MANRHVVAGASGQVGSVLYRYLEASGAAVLGTGHAHLEPKLAAMDVTDTDLVDGVITDFHPDVVWISAAMTDVDRCEKDPEASFRVNVMGPQNIARVAAREGAQVVFFSSDYVFDGRAGPYSEEAYPSPVQAYGRHKCMAEAWLLAHMPQALVIRTAWVYSREANIRNFVFRTVSQLHQGAVVRAAVDQFNTPTDATWLVTAALAAVDHHWAGILHLTGQERISRYALTCRIAEAHGFDATRVVPVVVAELGLPARRPLQGGLHSTRVGRGPSYAAAPVSPGE